MILPLDYTITSRHAPLMPSIRDLGKNIRRVRTQKGISQLALAHAIGYQGSDAGAYISRVESGITTPLLGTLDRIALGLGVPVEKLLSV